MAQVSVAEAAQRLGVGPQRVHQRITDGSLPAARVGHQWVVDEADVLLLLSDSRRPGRRLSPRSVWALLAVAADDNADGERAPELMSWLGALSSTERSRARARLHGLLAVLPPDPESQDYADAVPVLAGLLRSLLHNRAARRLYRAAPADLDDLRDDGRLVLAGLSRPESGMAAGDVVEAYVVPRLVGDLVEEYLLDQVTRDREANVVVHVLADVTGGAAWRPPVGWPILLAADLAEHRGPRHEARAAQLLQPLGAAEPPRRDGGSSDA